jgi:hypothetical protein
VDALEAAVLAAPDDRVVGLGIEILSGAEFLAGQPLASGDVLGLGLAGREAGVR